MSVRHNRWHNYRGQVAVPVCYAKMVDCIDGWTPEDFAGLATWILSNIPMGV